MLERAALAELVAELAKRPASRRALPGIKASRADIVLGAAVVLETVLEHGGFDGIEVTRAGLREGVFFSRRLLHGSAPLLADVRVASIRNLALQFDADIGHADHVARLALQLHDSLVAEGVIEPAPGERELLWAAALLHDIGMSIGYDSHPEHAHYLILESGLPGYGPREVELIAQIVRHHRKGSPDDEPRRPLRAAAAARRAARPRAGPVGDRGAAGQAAPLAAPAPARRRPARGLEPRAPDLRRRLPPRVRPPPRRQSLSAARSSSHSAT